MPYIEKDRRTEASRDDVFRHQPGDLAYWITSMVLVWIATRGKKSYATYATAVGVLETVKLELYRRAIAVYEDEKCRQNGEVFP